MGGKGKNVKLGAVPLELLRRYNVQGPRYPSYPTAPVWKEGFGPAEYEAALASSARQTKASLVTTLQAIWGGFQRLS